MRYSLKRKLAREIPQIYTSGKIVTGVNKEFEEFTGYSGEDVSGKLLIEVGDMLRLNSQLHLDKVTSKCSGYIFTKDLKAREVYIDVITMDSGRLKIYSLKEIPESRIEKKFLYIYKLLEDDHVGICIYSVPELTLLEANQSYLNILDKPFNSKEHVLGKKMNEFVDWSKRKKGEELFRNVISTGKTFYGKEIKGITEPWENIYCDKIIMPVSEKGKVKYIVTTVEEVTDRVLDKKLIIEQKQQLETIIDNMSEALLIFDQEGKYIKFNKASRDIFLPRSMDGEKIGDSEKETKFYDPDGCRIEHKNVPTQRVARGEKLLGYKMEVRADDINTYLDISGTPFYDEAGNFIAGLLIARDITLELKGIKEREGILKSQNKFLYRIIDTLDLPLIRLSYPELNIIDMNRKAFKVVNTMKPGIKSIDSIRNMNISVMMPDFYSDRDFFNVNNSVKQGKPYYLIKKRHKAGDSEIYSNIIFEPLTGISGETEELVIVMIDVTNEIKAQKKLEDMIQKQEEFLANISHELKTPLNVIYATAQLFCMYLNNGSLDDRRELFKKHISSMLKNCYRLSRLVNNVVDLSKIESGFFELNLSNNNIVEVVEEIVMSITGYVDCKGLNIIFDTDIEERVIACDPEKIERIVLNLISNAIKFSDKGNEIYVSIRNRDEYIEISVKDNGIGIEQNNFEMIFDRFRQVNKSLTRNVEGTGIGLSLVKAIVELHGGSITVESKLEEGSKFIVALPARRIMQENMMLSNKLRNNNESILLELSDINP